MLKAGASGFGMPGVFGAGAASCPSETLLCPCKEVGFAGRWLIASCTWFRDFNGSVREPYARTQILSQPVVMGPHTGVALA
jgi:hypothetical protein